MTTITPPTGRATTNAAPSSDWRKNGWRDDAACKSLSKDEQDLFFPVAHTNGWKKQTQKAKKVCASCPVREACLEWALDTGQSGGVWGGLSEAERRPLARSPFSHRAVALENLDYIARRVEDKVSLRQIAGELGIGHWAVRHAMTVIHASRAQEQEVSA